MRLSAFEQHVKAALEHYHHLDWLNRHSPLAEPYFLGALQAKAAPLAGGMDWGGVLRHNLYAAALTLWGPEPPASSEAIEQQLRRKDHTDDQYYFWVLALDYFHTYLPPNTKAPLLQAKIYTDILHISRATYDRHLHNAIHVFSERLLAHTQPTLRPEQPRLNKRLVGRTATRADCLAGLRNQRTVALSGVGGSGKTALGVAIADAWPAGAVFWFTIRPTLNDRLPSLLFALGHFFRTQGSAALWQHMVVQRGAAQDTNLALALVRHDLAQLPVPPLLCLDEIDLLRPANQDQILPEHIQLLEFLNSLRGYVAVLLIGQQAVLDSDQHYTLSGLTATEIGALLAAAAVPHSAQEIERLLAATGGNPRLLELCLALHKPGEPIAAVLDQLPHTPAFHAVFDRLWQRVAEDERQVLAFLSVFRSPAPAVGLQKFQAALLRLIGHSLVQEDQPGGVFLLPMLRHAIYHKLSAELRQHLHMQAAQLRANLGEYTLAIYHYQQAGKPAKAIEVWYPQMEQEIRRGHGWAALQTLQEIVIHRQSAAHQRQLTLMRARLYRLTGEADKALDDLKKVAWLAQDPLTVDKLGQEGFFLQISGDTDAALAKNQEGVEQIDRLLEQRAEFLVQIGRIYQRKRDMWNARLVAQRIKFEWERLQGTIEEEAGNVTSARTYLWGALATAEALKDETLIATCYYHLAILEARLLQEASALDYFHKALSHYQQVGDLYQVERTRTNIVALYVQLEQYEKVLEPAQHALRYFEMIRHPWMIAAVAANLAEACFYLGDVAGAEQYAQQVLRQEEQQYIPYALYTLGQVWRTRGDRREAEQCFSRSAQLAEQNEDPYILAYALQQWGLITIERGAAGEGRKHLQSALGMFEMLKLKKQAQKTAALLEHYHRF